MKAIQIKSPDGPEVFEWVDIARPTSSPGEVLVRAVAIGVGTPEKELFREIRAHLPKSPALRCLTMHAYDQDPVGRRQVAETAIGHFVAGRFNAPTHERVPLAEARSAHEMLNARQVMGRLILAP